MSVLLVTGIGVLLAGLVAAAFGIPVKEFSFGNTLILSGAVISCTGLVMISLSLVIRELRVISQRLRPGQAVLDRSNDLRLPASTIPPGKDIEDGHQPLSNADQNARDSGTDPAVLAEGARACDGAINRSGRHQHVSASACDSYS
jgi:hypothetical protein